MTITITVRGIDETLQRLERMRERLRDLSPVLDETGEAALDFLTAEVFGAGRTPEGAPWPSLVEGGRATLGGIADDLAAEADESSLAITVEGASEEYAAAHQFGGEDLPAREFMPSGDGELSGPAGGLVDETKRRLARYVATGEL